jgi:lantibiotic modifying enzyme
MIFLLSENDRNYIGIVFNVGDSHKFDISVYDKILQNRLNTDIMVYQNSDSLLLKYGILSDLNASKGIRVRANNADSLQRKFNYVYLDLTSARLKQFRW